jgi:hypothetical protein
VHSHLDPHVAQLRGDRIVVAHARLGVTDQRLRDEALVVAGVRRAFAQEREGDQEVLDGGSLQRRAQRQVPRLTGAENPRRAVAAREDEQGLLDGTLGPRVSDLYDHAPPVHRGELLLARRAPD